MFIVQLCEAGRKIQEVLQWLTLLVTKSNVWMSFILVLFQLSTIPSNLPLQLKIGI